jgi:DNA invertase Pin-like site-specific DNA recombinase
MTPKQARNIGITRSALWKVKQKIKQRKELNPKTDAVRKLFEYAV